MSEPASYKQERPKQIDWHSSNELNMEEKKHTIYLIYHQYLDNVLYLLVMWY